MRVAWLCRTEVRAGKHLKCGLQIQEQRPLELSQLPRQHTESTWNTIAQVFLCTRGPHIPKGVSREARMPPHTHTAQTRTDAHAESCHSKLSGLHTRTQRRIRDEVITQQCLAYLRMHG